MTLEDWLEFIERQHGESIALGLDRVKTVSTRLGQKKTCPLVLVGGTNGKGSTCAMLERILSCAGYRVGLYTSPHLLRYNERVRLDMRPVADQVLCDAFARVEVAREGIPLTYFEFGTLAAWEVFAEAGLDAIILEVGLGGRLDATNIYDPDAAIVTTVALDHMAYLGTTREAIGFEKAGIYRHDKPAIYGDSDPPQSLLEHARDIGARLHLIDRDFGYRRLDGQWNYFSGHRARHGLAYPALRGARQLANACCVLAALDQLSEQLPVAMHEVRSGLAEVTLAGRFQVLPGRPPVILDVAHNPQAAEVLAGNLAEMLKPHATWGICGMLRDKDIHGVIHAMDSQVDYWLPVGLVGPRAASCEQIMAIIKDSTVGGKPVLPFPTVAEALAHAQGAADENDRIAIFGSFLTVADALLALKREP